MTPKSINYASVELFSVPTLTVKTGRFNIQLLVTDNWDIKSCALLSLSDIPILRPPVCPNCDGLEASKTEQQMSFHNEIAHTNSLKKWLL